MSWHVSDLLCDLSELKAERAEIELQVTETKMSLDKALSEVTEKVHKLRSKLGIEFNNETFKVG